MVATITITIKCSSCSHDYLYIETQDFRHLIRSNNDETRKGQVEHQYGLEFLIAGTRQIHLLKMKMRNIVQP